MILQCGIQCDYLCSKEFRCIQEMKINMNEVLKTVNSVFGKYA